MPADGAPGTLERLRAALADRYAIEREVGSGGMATVYLARDVKHERQVAVKVLMPELARAMGPDRFLREIRVAASLNHPGILQLYDSGDADGLLYYVMPFARGESLEARIARETQLAIPDAVAIAREVSEALAYAHAKGIVHRDIKPANILLSEDRAMVADFGIARALGEADAEKLTNTGFAIGTPAYMSPEQASAEKVDGRSDIYSLGCVLYEMLIGSPPFQGPSAAMILARHSVEVLPGMRHLRDTLPAGLEMAVLKALAKLLADRYQTAREFAEALSPEAIARYVPAAGPGGRRKLRLIGTIAATLAIGAAAAVLARPMFRAGRAAPVASDRVAVLPFRSGAGADSSARRIGNTLIELLYQRLPAGEGVAAVLPGSVTAALRTARLDTTGTGLSESGATQIARDVGAGLALLGQVTSAAGRVVVSATLIGTSDGRELARIGDMDAPADQLASVADNLAARLLVALSHLPANRGGELIPTPLPVLRPYLAGVAAFARGAHKEAIQFFATALSRDSTMAPAMLGYLAAARFADTPTRAVELRAWAARDRLPPSDRAMLVALLGARYPSPPTDSETVQEWRDAADLMPGRSDVWFLFGEALFHAGPRLGELHALEQAGQAYRRAIEIDSAFAPAILHLVEVSSAAGDADASRRLRDRYLSLDSTGDLASYVRWRAALAVSDSAAHATLTGPWESLSPATLERVISVAQLDGRGMADATLAAAALQRMSAAGALSAQNSAQMTSRLIWTSLKSRELELNRGRPQAAAVITRAAHQSLDAARYRLAEIIEALFWDADSAGAAASEARGRQLVSAAHGTLPTSSNLLFDVCGSGLWDIAHGRNADAARSLRTLRSAQGPLDDYQKGYIPVCAALLDAWHASATKAADAAQRVEQLDSMMRQGPPALAWVVAAGNLTLAGLYEARGDIPRALAAVRRRPYLSEYGEPRFLVALSSLLREEGRLASLSGEREEAASAWKHYLALRADPEAALRPQADSVRALLARLPAPLR